MLDPRLLYTLFHAHQRELAEQAARDRLAASQRAERHALGHLLTAAGRALLALGTRLHGAQLDAVCQPGAPVHVRIPRRSPCTGK